MLSQLVQSLPFIGRGHGLQKGVLSEQPGPRHLGGIGFIAQEEPWGKVPSLTYDPPISYLVPLEKTIYCCPSTNSRGLAWKQASVIY